jgi:hypothetical protein
MNVSKRADLEVITTWLFNIKDIVSALMPTRTCEDMVRVEIA